MIYYVYDLYPRDDPLAGTRLVRFSMLQLAEYFHQRNGTGAGRIALRADETDAGFIEPELLQYVRVVRVNDAVVDGATTSGFSEKVIGGFFLEEADFLAIDTEQARLLTARGAGTLAYLDRAQMASHAYLNIIGFGDMDPFDQIWRLYAAGTGGELGAMLWRVITEAQGFRSGTTPYTHRHGDGTTHTDIHDDDRLENAIPAVTMTFDQNVDSSGNAWTVTAGEFTAAVGESVLSVTKRLMEAGLYVEMDPDTFELSAWEIANHGRDRTGLAWGADVVRFEPPPDEDQANGNILNDLKRAIRALIRRTWMLVGGQGDVYGSASAAGDVPWEGFYPSRAADAEAHEAVAARQITALDDAADTVRVRLHVANDPGNGSYLPGEHVRTDDTVTLHTGTDPWDWNEAAYPVAQWSIKTRHAGDTDAFVDLGSMYFSTADRQFQVPGGPGKHTHPPNPELCRPSQPDTTLYDLDFATLGKHDDIAQYGGGTAHWPVDDSMWSNTNPVGQAGGSDGCVVWGGTFGTGASPHSPRLAATPGAIYRWSVWAWSGAAIDDVVAVVFYQDDGGAGVVLATHMLAASVPVGAWTQYTDDYTAPANTDYMRLEAQVVTGNAGAYDTVTLTQLGTASVDGAPADTVLQGLESHGTSIRATRCDHAHAHGLLSDSGTHYHDADQIDGITTGAPTDATYLVATAHADLSAEVVVGATPGGELGGTWASPTVDSVHSGSAHLALGTTGSTAAAGNHTHATTAVLPLTAVVNGEPVLLWDENNSLIGAA